MMVLLMMLDAKVSVGGVASLVEVELLRLEYMVLPKLGVWLISRLRFMLVTPVMLPRMVSLDLPEICP